MIWRRGWDSNPRTPVEMLLEFQSSAFDRSATSPHQKRAASADQARGALARMILRRGTAGPTARPALIRPAARSRPER